MVISGVMTCGFIFHLSRYRKRAICSLLFGVGPAQHIDFSAVRLTVVTGVGTQSNRGRNTVFANIQLCVFNVPAAGKAVFLRHPLRRFCQPRLAMARTHVIQAGHRPPFTVQTNAERLQLRPPGSVANDFLAR